MSGSSDSVGTGGFLVISLILAVIIGSIVFVIAGSTVALIVAGIVFVLALGIALKPNKKQPKTS